MQRGVCFTFDDDDNNIITNKPITYKLYTLKYKTNGDNNTYIAMYGTLCQR